ncbi:forkhead family transcription factor FKH1 NDAI_0B03860 [Naumovozyma dairenensis CBS 421]|uniref:Fork-head domain-containing protein n=1 Tax=Naumovozyma dairenensis (strain ATCC 10597 / BCRC 20456 / CBS 421 / NBRC 0211 / NRRL Y-12639) TaxID=1071378 RepID=G0W6K9_NAUDC|nr:hypothetical protein NDAI_0B03860 [Naumovozyma dairenensis CBS 421]CCD23420.1 hypothetical protein NDAI_0B03860 [Naumovozyma dairenensis CBS 421]
MSEPESAYRKQKIKETKQQKNFIQSITSVLTTTPEPAVVTAQYANDLVIEPEIEAYAKLAGHGWTFFARDLKITLGRNTDSIQSDSSIHNIGGIDIDLGPTKVVSRKHATIRYNMESMAWQLFVMGRNGAKVDCVRVPVGPDAPPTTLHSGSLLDVGGIQMLFILPGKKPLFSDTVLNILVPRLINLYGKATNENKFLRALINDSQYMKEHNLHADPVATSSQSPRNNHLNDIDGSVELFQNSLNSSDMHTKSNATSDGHSFTTDSPVEAGDTLLSNGDESRVEQSNDNINQIVYNKSMKRDHEKSSRKTSWAAMIAEAILSKEEGTITLSDIYVYITDNYPLYILKSAGWKNAVRHNLSLNAAFEKVPRRANETGKGMYWRIAEAYKTNFLNQWKRGEVNKVRRGGAVDRVLHLYISRHSKFPEQKPVETKPVHVELQEMSVALQNDKIPDQGEEILPLEPSVDTKDVAASNNS